MPSYATHGSCARMYGGWVGKFSKCCQILCTHVRGLGGQVQQVLPGPVHACTGAGWASSARSRTRVYVAGWASSARSRARMYGAGWASSVRCCQVLRTHVRGWVGKFSQVLPGPAHVCTGAGWASSVRCCQVLRMYGAGWASSARCCAHVYVAGWASSARCCQVLRMHVWGWVGKFSQSRAWGRGQPLRTGGGRSMQ